MEKTAAIFGAVEGDIDDAVLRRLVLEAGGNVEAVYGKKGKRALLQKLPAYNAAARQNRWLIVIDLDHDSDCVPSVVTKWLPNPSPRMCFRVAVREVETWLLADKERMATYLGVPVSRLPAQPESLDDPKRAVVDLTRHSRKRDLKADIVPRSASGREVGPAYTSRLIEFVSDSSAGWRPEVAAENSDSLRRCLERLRELILR